MTPDFRYDRCAAAAAEIVNLHLDANVPKAVVFGRVLFVILETLSAAEDDWRSLLFDPSCN